MGKNIYEQVFSSERLLQWNDIVSLAVICGATVDSVHAEPAM